MHVGVLDERIEEVGGLDEREASVTKRSDGRIHADPYPGDGHVHEVRVLLLTLVILKN